MRLKTIVVFLTILLLASIISAYDQETTLDKFEIRLKSRYFTPPEKIAIEPIVSGVEGDRVHVLMQFKSIPDSSTKSVLKNSGIRLLSYIPRNTWFASIPVSLSPDSPVLSSTRWIGRIYAEDKIAPGILEEEMGDGKINLVVKYFKDVNAKKTKKRLEGLGVTILGEALIVNSITISIDKMKILVLANEDAIRWIEPVPPTARGESYRIRAHVQSGTAQSSLGLTGNGVTVGVFEDSHVYRNHPDFSGRAFKGDTDTTNYDWHATNVAGVIGGDGSVTYNYRGMAPDVDIYSYDYSAGANTAEEHDNYIGDLQTAITNHNIDVANNSWGSEGCDEFGYGNYLGLSPSLDGVVRGNFGRPITVVFSAGNERYGYGWDDVLEKPSDQHCISDTDPPYINYGTMNHPKSAKNTIVVGAVDSLNNKMTIYSDWGPTEDGRIKPEIVASGHHGGVDRSGVSEAQATNQLYLAPYYPDWEADYGFFGLTSCAAAATSGSIALLIEDFRNQDPVLDNPLPSTVKALLIHSAIDLDDSTSWYNPGPDYASGYGLLQIYDAIDLKRSGSAIQSQVGHGEEKSYFITVPAGVSSVKVTLVWDDVPGVENANPALVNDLNLYVVDDQGVHHHPWTLDPGDPSAPADRQIGNIEDGVDNINNVEQVVIDLDGTGSDGVWRAFVKGYNVPEGPQKFSIVANEVTEYAETVWNTLQLDPDGGRSASLALNSEGNPHIAHGTPYPYDELKYTWKSGGNWYSEDVATGHPVGFVSLALDSNGNPHIIYEEDFSVSGPRQNILTYAQKIGGSWVTEQLVGPSQNPLFCSLALDSNGNPHISYSYLSGTMELKYTYKTGGTWYTEDPDPGYNSYWTSIALDSADSPRIAYEVGLGSLQKAVKYARKVGSSWVAETVAEGIPSVSYAIRDLALNSADNPRIVYHEWETNTNEYGDLKYAWQDGVGGQWNKEIAVPASDLGEMWSGRWSSIAIDSNNVPHIAYYTNVNNSLKFARKIADSWILETVDDDSSLNVGLHASLALDSEATPHIAYQAGVGTSLRYAFASGKTAQSVTGEGPVIFSSDEGQLSAVTAVSELSLPEAGKPADPTFPFGFFSWTVTGLEPGQTFTLTMVYPSNVQSPAYYWKVIDGVWTDVTSLIGDDDGDNVLTFTGTDGGLGDADNSVNGEYSDPGGLAMLPLLPGDLDTDGDVDRNDLNIILAARNTPADGSDDPRDLDGDGMITVLDARKLVILCTRSRCATE